MNEKNKRMNVNDTESKLERFRLFAGLLQRYFTGQASEKENQIIDNWNAQSAWEKHREKVDDRNMDTACDEVWDKISTQLNFKNKHKTFYLHTYLRRYAAAAVIFILLCGSILYYTQHDFIQEKSGMVAQAKTSFQTADDQNMKLTLPDGTLIQMNRGTKFSYTTHSFNLKLREVWLTGEAFFEVAKNPDKPFIIHTGAMQTTVRGTSFNVKAYPQLNENIVSVRSGKVEVSDGTQTFGLLTHNKQLTYNTANKKTQIVESNWEDAAGWREGRLVLNGGVEELRLRLRQQFGVEVCFEKNTLANERLTGTFNPNSKLTDVLTTIGAIYNVRYTIKNNLVTITSFSSN